MAYSAWQIWLHPRLSRRVMAELEGEAGSLRRRADEQAEALRTAAGEAAVATDKMAQLELERNSARDEAAALTREAGELRGEVARLKAELAERREAAEVYAEVEKNMKRVGEMKDKYEKRIARLRDEIVRLKTASRTENPEAGELREIDMLGETIAPRPRQAEHMRGQAQRKTRDDGDWLELL